MSQVPAQLRYTKEHEWTRIEADGTVTVGITSHAVEALGDITMVSLPSVKSAVAKDKRFGDIDSVKAVSELFAPIDGEVIATNGALDATPEKVNEDPYGDGWMVKLRPADPSQLEGLLDATAYEKLIAEG